VSDRREEIASELGTPFYLYDLDLARARFAAARSALPGVKLLYALKANPNLAVARAIAAIADGADVASRGEIARATEAGFRPETLSFAGPGKTERDLREAIALGVAISAESVRELELIARLSSERARVLLRLNPNARVRAFAVPATGVPSPFGIDEDQIAEAAVRVRGFEGVHVHAGSQCPSARAFLEHAASVLDLAERLEKEHRLASKTINFGGGFGVGERELDVGALGPKLVQMIDRYRTSSEVPAVGAIELGRWLVAPIGTYVARVVSEKTSRGVRFVVLDGGMHHVLSASEAFPGGGRREIVNASRPEAAKERCTIVGPLCTPLDVIGRDVMMPRAEVGDLLAISGMGAYGLSLSPIEFLGHERPKEIVIDSSGAGPELRLA
jgi:diaminopimelate decarboxylase